MSYLIEVRGLKHLTGNPHCMCLVVSYRGTWVETIKTLVVFITPSVVSYRGTWVETENHLLHFLCT